MSDNVLNFRVADPLAPDADVVEALEFLLAEAEAGRVRGLMYTALLDGRQVGSGFTGEAVHEGVFTALGSITALQARFIKDKGLA